MLLYQGRQFIFSDNILNFINIKQGLSGVSRLLGLMVITELQSVQKFISTELSVGNESCKLVELASSTLKEPTSVIFNPSKTYSGFSGKIMRQLQVLQIMNLYNVDLI